MDYVLIGVLASCLAIIALACMLLRGPEDPYRGLPSAPPRITNLIPQSIPRSKVPMIRTVVQTSQGIVDAVFHSQSMCYHANKWIRTTLVDLLARATGDLIRLLAYGGAKKDEDVFGEWLMVSGTRYKRMIEDSMVELEKCNPNTEVVTTGPNGETHKITVGDIRKQSGFPWPIRM